MMILLYILCIGKIMDVLSTVCLLSRGFEEGNPLGVCGASIANICVFIMFILFPFVIYMTSVMILYIVICYIPFIWNMRLLIDDI